METDSAAFVTMLMDRLQTVEAAQQALQDTNEQLQRELQDVLIANEHLGQRVVALESSLHLEIGSASFNDGFILCLGFTLRPDWLQHPLDATYRRPLDALHYNATAFCHISTVHMRGVPSFEITVGKDFKPISVRQLLKAIETGAESQPLTQGGLDTCVLTQRFILMKTQSLKGLSLCSLMTNQIMKMKRELPITS